jgi:sugar lactone lactonase YvrE
MSNTLRLERITPKYAIPDGELIAEHNNVTDVDFETSGLFLVGKKCRTTAISRKRTIAVFEDRESFGDLSAVVHFDNAKSSPIDIHVGKPLCSTLHMVANPAIDPRDGAVIVTRSGSRGQQLPVTLFRFEQDGYLDEMPEAILNPTGVAFSPEGEMYVSNRAHGEIYAIGTDGTSAIFATGLGVATGIAFDSKGTMHVGDRNGTIYRVGSFADIDVVARLEPSVAAYHLAFDRQDNLYVSAPGLASHDNVYRIDPDGQVETFFKGLGRPQGLAFSDTGDLYTAACYRGRRGVVRISADGKDAEIFVAGNRIVGLCFTREGQMIVATNESIYSIDCGVQGLLP